MRVVTVAVSPHNTSQNCHACGTKVNKSLSTRTHTCRCGVSLCRDENAAKNILEIGLRTVGHMGTTGLKPEKACGHDHLCSKDGNASVVSGVEEVGNPSSDAGIPV